MKKFLWCLLFASLSPLCACVNLQEPLCSPQTLIDVPGLEGNFLMKFYDLEKLEMVSLGISFRRVSKGQYDTEDGISSACEIAGTTYVESKDAQTGYYEPMRLEPFYGESGVRGFQFLFVGASRSVLDQRKVPYEILTGDTSGDNSGGGPPTMQIKAILVKNAGLGGDFTAQLLDAMSLSMTLTPSLAFSPEFKAAKPLRAFLAERYPKRKVRPPLK